MVSFLVSHLIVVTCFLKVKVGLCPVFLVLLHTCIHKDIYYYIIRLIRSENFAQIRRI